MKHNFIDDKIAFRGLSSMFSRKAFRNLIDYNDVSDFVEVLKYYGLDDMLSLSISDMFRKIYSILVKEYRCEYIYKNELLNRSILKEYGTKHSVVFNEFKVGKSIADLALFNGESKAFEIKSDLDSTFRLSGQISDYTRLFQKCYVVVPESKLDEYVTSIGPNIGIIALKMVNKHLELIHHREAISNSYIDPKLVMGCLRTKEYKHLIETYFDIMPNVSDFEIFDKCSEMMATIPCQDLQQLFLREIESRKNSYSNIRLVQKELRQMCLSMNFNVKKITLLNQRLQSSLIY